MVLSPIGRPKPHVIPPPEEDQEDDEDQGAAPTRPITSF
jgi:hypothetical protein